MSNPKGADGSIRIILVDDIAETRESIKKLLAFEQDFKVIGSAGNGRDGVEMAKELKPDIILMDINMPDMDGLEAAGRITRAVPTAGVIMMSVQDDPDYMQRAMLAGARFFLPKPVNMDQLYSTIRNVYQQYAPMREHMSRVEQGMMGPLIEEESKKKVGERAGHIIAVYSPQGGAGCTTIATSLASGLMREGTKTLLVDGNLEFGDVGAFLNLQSQMTMVDVVENANDLDIEYFDSVVMTHNSGIKVLLGPSRPAYGAEIRDARPDSVGTVLRQVAPHYDFMVIDTSKSIDAVTATILEMAHKIVLVVNPTLPCIKNVKLVLDLFDQTGFSPDKTALVINRAAENPSRAPKGMPTPEKIQSYLKRPIEGLIPQVDESIILAAINRGVPVIAADRDPNKSPIKQLLKLSDHLYATMMGIEEFPEEEDQDKKRSWTTLFGNR